MERLVHTSSGWVVIRLFRSPWLGEEVSVQPFAPDGWELRGKTWGSKKGYHEQDEPLEAFLMRALSLTGDEAALLASQILGQWVRDWEERGGAVDARRIVRASYALGAVIPVAIALAAVGVALTVWVLVT